MRRSADSQRWHAEFVDPQRLGQQAGADSLAMSKAYTRAVLPPAIPGSRSGAGLACSSSGTPARISARILRDWGNVDSLCG